MTPSMSLAQPGWPPGERQIANRPAVSVEAATAGAAPGFMTGRGLLAILA